MKNRTSPASLVRILLLSTLSLGISAAGFAQQAPAAPAPLPASSKDTAVPPRDTADMLAEIKKSGKLRVGIAETVPWAMRDKDGHLIGFDVDIARKLARDIGVQLELHPDPFRYLIPDLEANRFDIIISGFSITARRALVVNFSQPYDTTSVLIGAAVKAAGSLKTLDAFNAPKIKIGVVEGTTAEDLAAMDFSKASIQTYRQDHHLFDDLMQGKISAAIADGPRLRILAKLYPNAITIPPMAPLGRFPQAFAVRRGDLDFINYLNSWIQARTADKWLDSHRTYWLRTTQWSGKL